MAGGGSQRMLIAAAAVLAITGVFLVASAGDQQRGRPETEVVARDDEPASAGADEPADETDGHTPPADQQPRPAPDDAPPGVGATGEPTDTTTSPAKTGGPDGDATGADPEATAGPRPTPTLPPGMRLPEPVQVPHPADVDGSDPSAVALAALTAVYSFDTTVDESSSDALARAEQWLAEEYGSQAYDLEGLERDVQREWWALWSEHHAFAAINSIEPHTTDFDTKDTAARAERRFYVRMTPVGRDAWNGNLVVHQWFVFLGRDTDSDDWEIVELRTPLAHR